MIRKQATSGLSVVLENMTVSQVLMHRPWEHVSDIYGLVTDSRVTGQSLRQRLIDGHPHAYAIEEKAMAKGIRLTEPFAGFQYGVPNLTIVGPSYDYYVSCLANFRSITEVTEEPDTGLSELFWTVDVKKVIRRIVEWWDDEALAEPDDDGVSSENNSGAICLFTFGAQKLLLTADAGVPALNQAIGNAAALNIALSGFTFFQVPHHGSKRNVGPSVLDGLLGTRRPIGSAAENVAFISVSKEGRPKHPSPRVVNALIRRGAKVGVTRGGTKCYFSGNVPDRGWPSLVPLQFSYEYEAEEDY